MSDSVTYEYDLNGRLKLLTFNNDDTVEVQYDDMGNRESVETTIASPLRLTSNSSANADGKAPQA
jgi:hypothetical protein